MRKIIFLTASIILMNTVLSFGQAGQEYILFDQDRLLDSLNSTLTCKRAYVGLESDSVGFPDLTIYNFLFKTTDYDGQLGEKKILAFEHFIKTGRKPPVDILITITPLTKTVFTLKDITASVINKEIIFLSLDSLLGRATKDIFHSIYAPMGLFEDEPALKLKRTDYKLVVKYRNKYRLIDSETLTESYYISHEPIEYYRPNAAGIFYNSDSYTKKMCLSGGKLTRFNGGPRSVKGGIMKDSSLTIGFEKDQKIPIHRFWTFSVWPAFTQYPKLDKTKDWYPLEGIGDFEYFWEIGIINGNFLDYFKNATVIYAPDKQFNKEGVNFWYRTKTINGKKFKDFFKGKYIESLIPTYM